MARVPVAVPANARQSDVVEKLRKLQTRIKNTSNVRFFASKRIQFDYKIAQLTIVILSLWAIVISFLLAMENGKEMLGASVELLQPIGILLPVFIVAFSLIENGETYLRAHQLEMCARQLREIGDHLYASMETNHGKTDRLIGVYREFSIKYNEILERSPVNHDDVDHYTKKYMNDRNAMRQRLRALDIKKLSDFYRIDRLRLAYQYYRSVAIWLALIARRQWKRAIFVGLWFVPMVAFTS